MIFYISCRPLRGLNVLSATSSWGSAALHPRLYADVRSADWGPRTLCYPPLRGLSLFLAAPRNAFVPWTESPLDVRLSVNSSSDHLVLKALRIRNHSCY